MKFYCPPLTIRGIIILCALAVVFLLYVPIPIIPEIARQYDISTVAAAGTVSIFGFAYATGFLIFGPLSDRLGRRNVLIYGLLSLTMVTWGLYFVHSQHLLFAGRAIQGLCASAFTPTAIAYLSERGTKKQKHWSIAWLSTAFLSAGLLGQLYGRSVATRLGMDISSFPLTLIYLLTAACLMTTPSEPGIRTSKSVLSIYSPIKAVLGSAELRRVYIPAFFLLMLFVSFYIMPVLLRSETVNITMLKTVTLPGFLTTFASIKMIGRYGAKNVITTGLLIAALGLLLSYFSNDVNHFTLMVASFVFVSGISLTVPALIARISELSDVSARGLAVAIYTFLLFLGASLGPWLPKILDYVESNSGFLLLSIIMIACAVYSATARNNLP